MYVCMYLCTIYLCAYVYYVCIVSIQALNKLYIYIYVCTISRMHVCMYACINIKYNSVASKYAVEGLCSNLRIELAYWNVHVCNINPGFMRLQYIS